MTFTDAIKTCFANYVTFSGRAPRSEYWWFALFQALLLIVAQMIDFLVLGADPSGTDPQFITTLVSLGTLLPSLAVTWRRMHDTGRPGWLVPGLTVLTTIVIALIAGGMAYVIHNQVYYSRFQPSVGEVLILVGLLCLATAAMMIWWLTRPGDAEANRFGPPPSGAGQGEAA